MHFRPACASPAAIACLARELAWPLAGPPLTYFAQLGLWGVHDALSSGFNVLYLFGADIPNKGLEMAVAVPVRSLGAGGSLPSHWKDGGRGILSIFWGLSH